jgi:hypothetical protein
MAVPAFSSLNKNQQLAVLIGVPLVLGLVLAYVSYRLLGTLGPDPRFPNVLRREGGVWAEVNSTQKDIDTEQQTIDRMPIVQAELKALQDEIKEKEQQLPREAEVADMRQLIERLMRDIPSEIGVVKYKSVKIDYGAASPDSRRGADYQIITYHTEIDADMNGMIKYIDLIEKNPRFMAVKLVNVKPGVITVDEPNQKLVYGLHQVSLDIATYIYNESSGKQGRPR